jgi:type 1 glutamine amidotransferase
MVQSHSPAAPGRTSPAALYITAFALALAAVSFAQTPPPAAPPQAGQGAGGQGAGRQGGQPADPAQAGRRGGGGGPGGGGMWAGQKPVNVLVVSGGCCHDYPGQNRLLYDILNKVAPIHWTFALGMTSIPDGRLPLYEDSNYAAKFDLVVHNECWTPALPPAFMQNIVRPHLNGVPAMIFHCSLHSYRDQPDGQDWWRELIGVTSKRHTRAHNIEVKWSQDDPITKDLPAYTTPTDELYVILKTWPGTKALGTAINDVDQGVAGAQGTISNDVYPVVWSHEFPADKGGARVFGTSLGHGNDTWNTPQFQEIVIRGFRWAMRKDPLVGWTPATAAPAGAPAAGAGRGRGGQ